MVKFHSKKVSDLLTTGIIIMSLISLNLLLSKTYFRLDLTQEKRFSMSEATVNLLKNLEEPAYITVYLDGDLPANFRRLQNGVKETLSEFEAHSNHKVRFAFEDPKKNKTKRSVNETQRKLAKLGIKSMRIFENKDGKKSSSAIFPGASLTIAGETVGVNLLKSDGDNQEETLNRSIEGLEYAFASAIQNLTADSKLQIGILSGNGEADESKITSLKTLLSKHYILRTIRPEANGFNDVDAIISVGATTTFSDLALYNIDQYLMNGGKALFFVDKVKVEFDSLNPSKGLVFPRELGLDRILFKYGVRVNDDLVQDLNCLKIPIKVGEMGGKPRIELIDWPFMPLVNHMADHPVTQKLHGINTKFAGTLDTVKVKGIKKSALLMSSPNTRSLQAPIEINLESLSQDQDPSKFNEGTKTLAYLLEGSFKSAFTGRFAPKGVMENGRKDKGKASKIIVVSDADIALNGIDRRSGKPTPLGFDPYSRITYSNADFIQNALSFLTDNSGLIQSRNKSISIRPLDAAKVKQDRSSWQILNLVTPPALVIFMGILLYWVRKRRYTGFH